MELMGIFAFLTSRFRSPQRNDDIALDKSITKCDKKQPQGRIVDLLKKQAQQPSSNTCPGLRPSDTVPRFSGAKKLDNKSKNPNPPRPGTIALTNGRPPGYHGKTVESTRQLDATRDRGLSSAVGRVSRTKTVISSADQKRGRVVQSSAVTRSGPLSQHANAQTSSTQASAGRSLGQFTDVEDSGLYSAVHHRATAFSLTSPSSVKEQHFSGSLGHAADPLHNSLSQAIPTKSSITFASPPRQASVYAYEGPSDLTHRPFKKQSAPPNEIAQGGHTYSSFIFRRRLIVHSQSQYHIRYPQLS
jgi:hypothetical protein